MNKKINFYDIANNYVSIHKILMINYHEKKQIYSSIHEVAIAPDTLSKTDPKYNIMEHHTRPEQAAKIFNEVKPKLATYSHIVKLYGRTEDEIMK